MKTCNGQHQRQAILPIGECEKANKGTVSVVTIPGSHPSNGSRTVVDANAVLWAVGIDAGGKMKLVYLRNESDYTQQIRELNSHRLIGDLRKTGCTRT